jgi:ribosomal-protein-alanine N-acetyltransferase
MRQWRKAEASVRRAEIGDCDVLSEIHAGAFRRGWSSAEFEALLSQPGVHALMAHARTAFGGRIAAGFALYRLAADEAEILSIAVIPQCRRRGVAKLLLEEAMRHLYREGVHRIHLEVEDENEAALRLYRGMEFRENGMRPGYYSQGRARPAGAIAMLRQLRPAE